MLLVPVPSRFAMSLALNSTRSVLKSGSMKEDTFSKQPVYVVVPGTMVNDNSAPVSTKTAEPGVCPVSLRVIMPATVVDGEGDADLVVRAALRVDGGNGRGRGARCVDGSSGQCDRGRHCERADLAPDLHVTSLVSTLSGARRSDAGTVAC